eukprot:TRINITY_DN18279_c0_g1_i2.p1 TRINITY_DN18279_c0_g1~~TRINITY_DN18279_c0_g1_i2.p1  ORF type:complete len:170 (-),score=30.76 TRINITY_DN18279_c0_g1_i2:260-769(-)
MRCRPYGTILAQALLVATHRSMYNAVWCCATLCCCDLLHISGQRSNYIGVLTALAMAGQNVSSAKGGSHSLNTTFVTGNVQKIGEGVYNWVLGHCASREFSLEKQRETVIVGFIWVGYMSGAAVGAEIYYLSQDHEWSFSPAGGLLLVTFAIQDWMFNKFVEEPAKKAP